MAIARESKEMKYVAAFVFVLFFGAVTLYLMRDDV